MINLKCKICGNEENNEIFKVKEMMFGTKEVFDYFECNSCGCLQIIDVPPDIERYYSDEEYYSFDKLRKVRNTLTKFIRIKRNEYILFNQGRLGKLVNEIFPHPGDSIFYVLNDVDLKRDCKILDVGCGNGAFLYYLRELGFNNLTGIDPYISKEIIGEDLKIFRISIQEIPDDAKFDLVIFNHSLEHLSHPSETISKLSEILSEKGLCIIRMPVKNDYIWDLYGTSWMQIDAPRHFYIHTTQSFQTLLNESNLEIKKIVFDSSEYQFYASEQIKKDIPLISERSYLINPNKSVFTKKQIQEYKKKAKELNDKNMGDQAIFFIKKAPIGKG